MWWVWKVLSKGFPRLYILGKCGAIPRHIFLDWAVPKQEKRHESGNFVTFYPKKCNFVQFLTLNFQIFEMFPPS